MLTYEADQRHADLLMAAYGLNVSSKGKAIPWDKATFLARHPLAGPFLDEKRRVEFRSNCKRCLYLALDRFDIQFTAKEISRALTSPKTWLEIKTGMEDWLSSWYRRASRLKRLRGGAEHSSGLRFFAMCPGFNFAMTYNTMMMGSTVFVFLATLFLSRSWILHHAALCFSVRGGSLGFCPQLFKIRF